MLADGYVDAAARRCEFDGVVQQIGHNDGNFLVISVHPQIRLRHSRFYLQIFRRGELLLRLNALPDNILQEKVPWTKFGAASINVAEIDHVIYQPPQLRSRLQHNVELLALLSAGFLAQETGIAQNEC